MMTFSADDEALWVIDRAGLKIDKSFTIQVVEAQEPYPPWVWAAIDYLCDEWGYGCQTI